MALALLFVGIGLIPGTDASTRVFLVAMFGCLLVSEMLLIEAQIQKSPEPDEVLGAIHEESVMVRKVMESQELAGQALATILQFIHNAQGAGPQRRE